MQLTTFEKVWGYIEDAIIGIFAAIALLLVCYEVGARYFVPSYLTDWGSEVIIYLTVWAMLIAGSPLVLHARHIRADLVIRMLPIKGQWVLELINLLIGLIYCGIVAYYALQVVLFAQQLGELSESSLQFPLWIFYSALPLAFGLMTVRYLFRVYRFLFHFDESMLGDGRGDESVEERIRKSQT